MPAIVEFFAARKTFLQLYSDAHFGDGLERQARRRHAELLGSHAVTSMRQRARAHRCMLEGAREPRLRGFGMKIGVKKHSARLQHPCNLDHPGMKPGRVSQRETAGDDCESASGKGKMHHA